MSNVRESQGTQPRIRFKGFSDAWEERKFSSMYEKNMERNDGQFEIHRTISIANMYFKEKGNGAGDKSIDSYKVFRLGDIAFEGNRSKHFAFGRMVMNDIGDGIMSPRFTALRPKQEQEIAFWKILIHYEPIMRYILVRSTKKGTMMNELVVDDFMKQSIHAPEETEQVEIGRLFAKLENLITVNQREEENLQKVKKALLQRMFVSGENTAPDIRFNGYTDAWEKRKLGDLGSVAMNRRIFKNQTTETGDVPFFKIGTFGGEPDAYISRELFEEYKKQYPFPKVGDLLISASGSIGRIVEYTGRDEYFQDSNIVWLDHGKNLSNSFLRQFYAIVKWQGLEGSTIKRLYNKNILETDISLPSVDEQSAIGILLGNIDKLITVNQRETENLKQLKKSLLQNMFV